MQLRFDPIAASGVSVVLDPDFRFLPVLWPHPAETKEDRVRLVCAAQLFESTKPGKPIFNSQLFNITPADCDRLATKVKNSWKHI